MWRINNGRIRRRRIKSCRIKLSCGVVVLVALTAGQPAAVTQGQTRSYYGCCPQPIQLRQVEPAPSRVRMTYGGRIYYAFPNYDVVLSGAPRNVTELIQGTEVLTQETGTRQATVVFKNDEGMRWDGTDFFLHPAYPIEYVTRYHYADRIVGKPQQQWPEPPDRRPVDPRDRLAPAPSVPTVTQVQPGPVAPTYVPYQYTTMRFLPAPWVVAPVEKPSVEPTPPEKTPESPSAKESSPTAATTSGYEIQQKINAAAVPSYEQGQTVRRVLKAPVNCWLPKHWSSPECIQYRQRQRQRPSTSEDSRPPSSGAKAQ